MSCKVTETSSKPEVVRSDIFHATGEAPGQRAFFSHFDHHGRLLLEAREGECVELSRQI